MTRPIRTDAPSVPDELRPTVDSDAGLRTFVPWKRAPFPAPWTSWFGRDAPLHLEIGFGDGRYTVRRALARPEEDFVGLEVSGVSVRRALRKVARARAGNVRLLKAMAQVAVRQLFAPAALHTITVNFPDPWPKSRHAEKRLLRGEFLDVAAERLVAGGEIRLATDHADYLAFSRSEAERSGWFDPFEVDPPPDVFETKYALKWRDHGKPLYYLVLRRNDASPPNTPPIERSSIMPHAFLTGRPREDLAFEKQVVPYAGGHVVLHELTRSLGGDGGDARWLVRVTVTEEMLDQQLLVVVQRRADRRHIVRLGSFGDPIVTPVVRGAIHAVTEWFCAHAGVDAGARNY